MTETIIRIDIVRGHEVLTQISPDSDTVGIRINNGPMTPVAATDIPWFLATFAP
jgi:hypothetical protein